MFWVRFGGTRALPLRPRWAWSYSLGSAGSFAVAGQAASAQVD